jgi:hypothetical protein
MTPWHSCLLRDVRMLALSGRRLNHHGYKGEDREHNLAQPLRPMVGSGHVTPLITKATDCALEEMGKRGRGEGGESERERERERERQAEMGKRILCSAGWATKEGKDGSTCPSWRCGSSRGLKP